MSKFNIKLYILIVMGLSLVGVVGFITGYLYCNQ
jgi:hypothetical protein